MFYLKSHLDQKYDQEVEVCDSSELLKQILGNEVPEGILWDRVAAAGLLSQARKNNNTSSSSPMMHSFTDTRKVRCVILKNMASEEITWWSKYETKE